MDTFTDVDIQEYYESVKSKFKRVTGTELEEKRFSLIAVGRILSQLSIAMNKVNGLEAEAEARVEHLGKLIDNNNKTATHLERKKRRIANEAEYEFMELATQAMDIVSKLEKLLDVVENNEFKQDYVDQLSEITGVIYKPTDINDKPEGTTVDCLDLGALNNLVEPNPVKGEVKEVEVVTKVDVVEPKLHANPVVNASELMKIAKEAKTREELTVLLAELDVMLEEKRLEPSATRKKEIQKDITRLRSKINYRKKKLQ